MAKPFNIFHTKVDRIDFDQALTTAKEFIHSEKTHTIVTPNPEILLKAEHDQQYRNTLNSADLRLPDGSGVVWASKFLQSPIPERVPGVDFLATLLLYAQKHHHSVHILLHEDGLSKRHDVREYLNKKMPKLSFVCQEVSTPYLMSGHIIDDIMVSSPDILIVTFGAPLQELWVQKNKNRLKKVSIVMSAGGSFDMLTGKIPRAPRWMRKIALEWLWRLIIQPDNRIKRAQRIFNAVVIFSFKVFVLKLRSLFLYRTNGLAFIYKDKDSILLLHKRGYADEKHKRSGHWALPQGGIEKNEPLVHGVLREVKEETGIVSIGKITRSRNRNKYTWSPFYRNIYSHRYAGQKQKAFFLEFTGDDEEIRLNYIGDENFDAYAWVSQNELLSKLEYARQPYAKRLLLEFNRRNVYNK